MLPALVVWSPDDETSTICLGLMRPGDTESDATRIDGEKFPGDSCCVSPFHVTPAYADLITRAKLREDYTAPDEQVLPVGTYVQILNTTVAPNGNEMEIIAKCRYKRELEFECPLHMLETV